MVKVACALFLSLALGRALAGFAKRSAEGASAAYVSTFEIISTMPHDPNAFTQGLTFAPDGTLYESDGALLVQILSRTAGPRSWPCRGLIA
jgi:glutamine cyclotransferase